MPPSDPLPDISPFYEIEVWCTFTRRWVPGFWFDGLEPDGSIRLRRGIDQARLSGTVPASSVRTRQSAPGRITDLRQPRRASRPDSDAVDPNAIDPDAGDRIVDDPRADHPAVVDGTIDSPTAVDLRSDPTATPRSGWPSPRSRETAGGAPPVQSA